MNPGESGTSSRKTDVEIEVAASPDAVWKALTDAEELARWFPMAARVKPGVGGSIFLSWGPGCEGEAPITAWEPGRHFQWQEKAIAADGSPEPERRLIIDWKLESRGGKTFVRLVNSGFLAAADWEDEYFGSTNYGWRFMLLNLRHYLEHHAGQNRQVAWPRKKIPLSREEAYRRLVSANGVFRAAAESSLRPGAHYALESSLGESYSGRVEFVHAPRGFCVTVESLNNALFWVTIEGAPGKHDVQLWLSAYGLPDEVVRSFEERWLKRLEELFA